MIITDAVFESADPYDTGIVTVQTGRAILSQAFVIIFMGQQITHREIFFVQEVDSAVIGSYPDHSLVILYDAGHQVHIQTRWMAAFEYRAANSGGRMKIKHAFRLIGHIQPGVVLSVQVYTVVPGGSDIACGRGTGTLGGGRAGTLGGGGTNLLDGGEADLLDGERMQYDTAGMFVHLLQPAVFVYDPPVAVRVVSDAVGLVGVDRSTITWPVPVVDRCPRGGIVFIEACTGGYKPKIAVRILLDIDDGVGIDVKAVKKVTGIAVEFFGERVINIKAIAGRDPEVTTGAFEYLHDIVIAKGCRVLGVMVKYPEGIPVIAIKTGHGAQPKKAFFILANSNHFIMGKTPGDVQPGEPVFIFPVRPVAFSGRSVILPGVSTREDKVV